LWSYATEEAKGTKGSSPAPPPAVEEQEQPDDPPPSDEKERAAAADLITEMEEPKSEAEKAEEDSSDVFGAKLSDEKCWVVDQLLPSVFR